VAILGAGVPDRRVAQRLAKREGLLVMAFDADEPGRAGASRLRELLATAGRTDVIDVEPPTGDLNAWLVARGCQTFEKQLGLSINLAVGGRRSDAPNRSIA